MKFVGRDEAEDLAGHLPQAQSALIAVGREFRTTSASAAPASITTQRRKERETIDRDVDANDLSPVSREIGPVAALEQRDRVVLLRQAMAALPDTLRTAVLMRDIQELSYQ